VTLWLRQKLRPQVCGANRGCLFEEERLARIEPRYRHDQGTPQQQGKEQQCRCLQRPNMILDVIISLVSAATAQPKADLDDNEKEEKSHREMDNLVDLPDPVVEPPPKDGSGKGETLRSRPDGLTGPIV
jgi:hypothetical protein